MLFLTSCTPYLWFTVKPLSRKLLAVDLIKKKKWPLEHQVFLVFALLWVRNKLSYSSSVSNFLSDGEAILLLSFSAPGMLLFERKKSIPVYRVYLKCDNPVVNIKWYIPGEEPLLLKLFYYII